MKFTIRVALAVLSGAVIAYTLTAMVLYAMFAAGSYRSEALVELPLSAFGVVGACGGLVGLMAALLSGRISLPRWVRSMAIGSLAGVAAVVIPTLGIACSLGGPSSLGQAPYLQAGLVIGVPVGLTTGALAGLVASRRRRAFPREPPRES